jgi:hypothetical protein
MKITTLLTALVAATLTASALAAPQKIEFWTFSMKPKFTPYFEGIVKNYEAANPGVKLEWVDFPWDIIQTKLVTRIVAGTPPALVNLNVPWADEFARDGLLTPVDELIAPARARYLKSALEDLTFSGKTYGFPLYSNVAVIAYNTEIFKAAGIARAPRSLDEQLALARQIAERTGKAGLCPALSKIDGLMMQQGLPVIRNGRAVFDSPAHVAFIRKLADTYKAGGLLKDGLFAEDNFPVAIDAYKGGRLGMLLAPPTALKPHRERHQRHLRHHRRGAGAAGPDRHCRRRLADSFWRPRRCEESSCCRHRQIRALPDQRRQPARIRQGRPASTRQRWKRRTIRSSWRSRKARAPPKKRSRRRGLDALFAYHVRGRRRRLRRVAPHAGEGGGSRRHRPRRTSSARSRRRSPSGTASSSNSFPPNRSQCPPWGHTRKWT